MESKAEIKKKITLKSKIAKLEEKQVYEGNLQMKCKSSSPAYIKHMKNYNKIETQLKRYHQELSELIFGYGKYSSTDIHGKKKR